MNKNSLLQIGDTYINTDNIVCIEKRMYDSLSFNVCMIGGYIIMMGGDLASAFQKWIDAQEMSPQSVQIDGIRCMVI